MANTSTSLHAMPPTDLRAEQLVLSAMFHGHDVFTDQERPLDESDFFHHRNRIVFRTLKDCHDRNRPRDLASVTSLMSRCDRLTAAGGEEYLEQLFFLAPNSQIALQQVRRVIEAASLRRALQLMETAMKAIGQGRLPTMDFVARLECELAGSRSGLPLEATRSIREITADSFRKIEALFESRHELAGHPTGLESLDRLVGGLQPASLWIVGSMESRDATGLALSLIARNALLGAVETTVIATDLSADDYGVRILSSQAMVPEMRLRLGELTAEHWTPLTNSAALLAASRLNIVSRPRIRASQLGDIIQRVAAPAIPKLIVLDSLRGLTVGGRPWGHSPRTAEALSLQLRELADNTGATIVALSDLPGYDDGSRSRKPEVRDLGCRALASRADVVLLLHATSGDSGANLEPRSVSLRIAKNRHGLTARLPVTFVCGMARNADPGDLLASPAAAAQAAAAAE